MKALSLITFATVFLLSVALPEDKGKGQHSSLLESDGQKFVESLQRKKPPSKLPGPAITADNQFPEKLSDENRNVYLTSDKNKKHAQLDNGKKHKDFFSAFLSADNVEETQRERSDSLGSEFNPA